MSERLRRHPRLSVRAIEPRVWGLFNPDRSTALFIDDFARALLDAVDALGDPEAALRLVDEADESGPSPHRAMATERLESLVRFGALVAVPADRAPAVLLVDPPCPADMRGAAGPAKGLCYLAAALEAAGGPRVRILDLRSSATASEPNRAAQAAAFCRHAGPLRPRIVGITAVSATIDSACFIAGLARLLFPTAYIVLGGQHASYEWKELLSREPAIDAVVLGEGELSFPALVERVLAEPEGAHVLLDGLHGVAWRRADGTPVSAGWSPAVEELDSLPMPRDRAYLVNADEAPIRVARILTARGCTFSCSFCSTASFTGRRIRRRSVASVIAEVAAWSEDGVNEITFDDDIFTSDRRRALALCAALRESGLAERVVWGCNTRLDCLDDEIIDALAAAGCRCILIGVESGDVEIQRRFGKGRRSLEGFRDKILHLARRGIEAQLNFILGLPGEDRASLAAITDLVAGMPTSVKCAFNFLNVFPGTPLARDLDAFGIRSLAGGGRGRYSTLEPTVATPALDGDAQIDAFLRLRWFCETGRDTLRAAARAGASA